MVHVSPCSGSCKLFCTVKWLIIESPTDISVSVHIDFFFLWPISLGFKFLGEGLGQRIPVGSC